jgi:hypothetical protein
MDREQLAEHEYNWMTDESEAASGDYIIFADESEWMDECDDEGW